MNRKEKIEWFLAYFLAYVIILTALFGLPIAAGIITHDYQIAMEIEPAPYAGALK